MKVSDYIVDFLIKRGVADVFGYPGGMVTYIMSSLSKRQDEIKSHLLYHEQGVSFALCGYCQVTEKPSMAYATSGPGATNLITGICNAYFDSIPTLFVTGQVNTFESKSGLGVRQKGFQETDIVSMVKSVTKYCAYVDNALDIKYHLEKAFYLMKEGRSGPVLLDIPMNIQRAEIEEEKLNTFEPEIKKTWSDKFNKVFNVALCQSRRPCVILGAGIKTSGTIEQARAFVRAFNLPVVSSMPAVDVMPAGYEHYYGFIGAYGHRCANFIVAKADLLIVLGSRLDCRQTGADRVQFGRGKTIVRVDIDGEELNHSVGNVKVDINTDLQSFFNCIKVSAKDVWSDWRVVCQKIRTNLDGIDKNNIQEIIKKISAKIADDSIVASDVGQNQVWIAQHFEFKKGQKLITSSGHGAMGYSLPGAIGAYYATGQKVFSFNGDGGLQMNIQELHVVSEKKLPIKIIVFNNSALGMIRHFQEMYFDADYFHTVDGNGYDAPNIKKIAKAYDIRYSRIITVKDVELINFDDGQPEIIEIFLSGDTYVFPKLEFGRPIQDQEPLLDRTLLDDIMEL